MAADKQDGRAKRAGDLLADARSSLEDFKGELEDKLSEMENQDTPKGEKLQEQISNLDDAINYIESAEAQIEEITL